jgi:hypothetical protein
VGGNTQISTKQKKEREREKSEKAQKRETISKFF